MSTMQPGTERDNIVVNKMAGRALERSRERSKSSKRLGSLSSNPTETFKASRMTEDSDPGPQEVNSNSLPAAVAGASHQNGC